MSPEVSATANDQGRLKGHLETNLCSRSQVCASSVLAILYRVINGRLCKQETEIPTREKSRRTGWQTQARFFECFRITLGAQVVGRCALQVDDELILLEQGTKMRATRLAVPHE